MKKVKLLKMLFLGEEGGGCDFNVVNSWDVFQVRVEGAKIGSFEISLFKVTLNNAQKGGRIEKRTYIVQRTLFLKVRLTCESKER